MLEAGAQSVPCCAACSEDTTLRATTPRRTASPPCDARSPPSGVLLHPTSLPGPHGIGDLGARGLPLRRLAGWPPARALWQVLPLTPASGPATRPTRACRPSPATPLLVALEPPASSAAGSTRRSRPPNCTASIRCGSTSRASRRGGWQRLREAAAGFAARAAPAERAAFEAFRAEQRGLAGRLRAVHGARRAPCGAASLELVPAGSRRWRAASCAALAAARAEHAERDRLLDVRAVVLRPRSGTR